MARRARVIEPRSVWTPWEIRDSLYVLDWIRCEVADPLEHQDHAPALAGILRPWQLRDDQVTADELARVYAYRQN